MKKTLLLDLDEVVVFNDFLKLVNEFMGTNYEIDDITNYYIDEEVVPQERMEEFNRFVNGRNLYENARLLPGALEAIKLLSEKFDVYICSSCVNPFDIQGSGRIFKDKYDFLLKNLPFIPPERYIFTSSKNIFKADIKIDDRLSNLKDDIDIKILFPSYHNKDISNEELDANNVIRAGFDWRTGWEHVTNILLGLDMDSEKKI